MLFNSYVFILAFLPITLIGYYALNHFEKYKAATVWLCLASLFFYGFFNWSYLPIMLFSIGFNYCLSRLINQKSKWGGDTAIKDYSANLNPAELWHQADVLSVGICPVLAGRDVWE